MPSASTCGHFQFLHDLSACWVHPLAWCPCGPHMTQNMYYGIAWGPVWGMSCRGPENCELFWWLCLSKPLALLHHATMLWVPGDARIMICNTQIRSDWVGTGKCFSGVILSGLWCYSHSHSHCAQHPNPLTLKKFVMACHNSASVAIHFFCLYSCVAGIHWEKLHEDTRVMNIVRVIWITWLKACYCLLPTRLTDIVRLLL